MWATAAAAAAAAITVLASRAVAVAHEAPVQLTAPPAPPLYSEVPLQVIPQLSNSQFVHFSFWRKGNDVFLAYGGQAPRFLQHPDIDVDTTKSNYTHVVLNNVQPSATGGYTVIVAIFDSNAGYTYHFAEVTVNVSPVRLNVSPAPLVGSKVVLKAILQLRGNQVVSFLFLRKEGHTIWSFSSSASTRTATLHPGVEVDSRNSNSTHVLLNNVQASATGTYTITFAITDGAAWSFPSAVAEIAVNEAVPPTSTVPPTSAVTPSNQTSAGTPSDQTSAVTPSDQTSAGTPSNQTSAGTPEDQ